MEGFSVIGMTSKLASIHVTTNVSSSQVHPVGQKARALAAEASSAATHMNIRRGGEGLVILLAVQHRGISGMAISSFIDVAVSRDRSGDFT